MLSQRSPRWTNATARRSLCRHSGSLSRYAGGGLRLGLFANGVCPSSRVPVEYNPPMPTEFTVRHLVQFSETDMAGIVHFSNYFRWMEEVEHAFLRSLGMSVSMRHEGK